MSAAFGAVPGAVIEEGHLVHLGNPVAEQRALMAGTAVVPLDDRAVVKVSGEDRLTWLDSVTSQALAHLSPGESTELLVLDPNGRIEHAAGVVDDGATTWLFVDAADAAALAAWLQRMRFRMRVEVGVPDDLALVGATATASAVVAAHVSNGVELVWHDPWPHVSAGGVGYAPEPHEGAARRWSEIVVSRAQLDDLARRAIAGQVRLAGVSAAEALRVAAWRPRWSREVDDRTLPHELDWLRTAVHMNKGCYRGQETVAKVHNLGHPPRRIVAVDLDGSGSVLPEPGADLIRDDSVIGRLTSVVWHADDGPLALAVVRRSAADGGAVVAAGDEVIAAQLRTIVPADAGAAAQVPRLTKLSRRPQATPPAK